MSTGNGVPPEAHDRPKTEAAPALNLHGASQPYPPIMPADTLRDPSTGRVLRLLLSLGCLATPAIAQTSPPSGRAVELSVPSDATVESLFVDFLHYARMGRFALADAYVTALLTRSDLDPVEVMRVANRDEKSLNTLLLIIKHSSIGDSAAKVLELIHEGERLRRNEPERIRANIAMLGGNPQQERAAIVHLIDSGEYAVPQIVQSLLDPAQERLRPRVVNALSRLEKPAVNPLVMALSVEDNDVRLHLIRALGAIGYPQAIPYFRRLIADEQMPEETQAAAAQAIHRIEGTTGRTFPGSAADMFHGLAEWYYNELDAVRADPRLADANVWYWDPSARALAATIVPQSIFGPVMAMRCCEGALLLQHDHAGAIALWLAANIRRESRLAMNIESGDPDETGEPDATRPAVFPRALYFSQAAGPRYAHLVLARAVADRDTAVALGAIEALRITAGESSLVGTEDLKQPLVQALRFPDQVVRIRAALALGAALPKSPFADAQYVIPLLASALTLTGQEQVLVIDPDQRNLNRVTDGLRATGRRAIAEANFPAGMTRARAEFQSLAGVFLSTDVAGPDLETALSQLRSEFIFAKTPVVVLVKSRHDLMAERLAGRDAYVETVDASADDDAILGAWERVRGRTGQSKLSDALSLSLALEATETLRRIVVDGRTVYDARGAESALIAALAAADENLQTKAAAVLALAPSPAAQTAIAAVGLEEGHVTSLRVSAFGSLAESAKNNGSLLGEDQLAELVAIARDDTDLTIRTAASQALGALNLASNKASEIIRSYYGG